LTLIASPSPPIPPVTTAICFAIESSSQKVGHVLTLSSASLIQE
jgi:hypothetical protein